MWIGYQCELMPEIFALKGCRSDWNSANSTECLETLLYSHALLKIESTCNKHSELANKISKLELKVFNSFTWTQ